MQGYPTMFAQVIAIVFLTALTADADDGMDSACVSILNECKAKYEEGNSMDWDNLLAYESSVEPVDCPADVAGTDLKKALVEEIELLKQNWGRDWDIINSAPRQLSSVTALAVPILVIFRYCNF